MQNITRAPFPLVGPSKDGRIPILGTEKTINMFIQEMESPHYLDTSTRSALVKFPGFTNILEFVDGQKGRASFVNKINPAVSYHVIEDKVYSVSSSLVPTLIGTIDTNTGHVGIDQNQTQVIFVDGVKGYVWNFITDTWTELANGVTANFPASPLDVVVLNDYGVVVEGDTNKYHLSHLGDLTTYDGIFETITTVPDTCVACGTIDRQLYIFGNQSIEIWYDAGISDFPFQRYTTTMPPYGCASADSIAEGFGYLFFLGKDGKGSSAVFKGIGGQFQSVTDNAIGDRLESLSDISDAVGNLYRIDGKLFYQLSFTAANLTLLYDINIDCWYDLQMLDGARHLMQSHCYFNGKHYITDYKSNKLYEFSTDYLKNDTESIHCSRSTTIMAHQTRNNMTITKIHVTGLNGEGLSTTDHNSDPTLFLSVSRNEGITYEYDMDQKTGKGGEYRFKIKYNCNLSQSDNYVFKFDYYDDTKFILTGMVIDYRVEAQ